MDHQEIWRYQETNIIAMKLIINLFLAIAISLGVFAQEQDFGKALVEAINSPSLDARRLAVKSIFSNNALSNPGVDPIMAFL
jgi:hypothetical protein